ncbi:PTS transporter subunit EIIC [Lactiplantibacillus plantarum]|uniref:PTS transporter subunit EIIC n=1 Tax=Lactiplantibacillus plantarum TaxID=1590 RepID=UPI0007B54C6D|nr:PTS transporter subunit EIIC [Lactiplantibacillus plantarum]KZU23771.1 PTS system beta-glucoside-specific IIBcomponent [Lactiplantibacillus plantarum]KZU23850.1 PTS system beta-glucoside-specific IIBcomponent [Lactiplantibacillus plantarum]
MNKKNGQYEALALAILKKVGGPQNISSVTHCMTRLRFNLKDSNIPNDDEVKKISGVLGVVRSGGQYQVVIGQTVSDVYAALLDVSKGKLTAEPPIDLNVDKDLEKKNKLSLKNIGNAILNKLAGSLTPLIPVLMVGGVFKMLVTILGPQMLKILAVNSDLYRTFAFVGDACFYFLPILVGYTAAKQFHTSKVLGMLLGAIMLQPDFVKISMSKAAFSIYGIPMFKVNYASSIIPIILTVWVMSYVYAFLNKHIGPTLRTIFVAPITVAIMLPISLCVLGPLGGIIGDGFSTMLVKFGNQGGVMTILTIVTIGALWEFMVLTGMHLVLMTTLLLVFTQVGHEGVVSVGALCATFAVSGVALGAALKAAKSKKDRALFWGFFVSAFIGGVTEPTLYGLILPHKRTFLSLMIGGACGALYGAIAQIINYMPAGASNFLSVLGFSGGVSVMNLINAIIAAGIAFSVAALATYLIGYQSKISSTK